MAAEKQRLIFISYSSNNRGFALELAKELKASGFRVWFDQLDIPKGSRWDDEIEKALSQCEVFLVILTKQSIESHNVKDEIGYAIDSNKRILPILLEEVNVPFRLRRFQYVDFTTKSNNEGIDLAKELLRTLMNEAEEAETEPAIPQVPSRQPEVDRSEELQADAHRLARQRADAIRKAREREQMDRSSQVTPSTPSFERIPSQPQPSIRPTPQPQKGPATRRPAIMAGGVIIALLCLGVLWGAWRLFTPPNPPPPTTVVPTTVTPSITPTHNTITVTPSFTPIVVATTQSPTEVLPTTPAPLRPDPVQTIKDYWNYFLAPDSTLAWNILSPAFQIREINIETYAAKRENDRINKYCRIETDNGREISNDGRTAVVAITVKYYMGACPGTEAPWDFEIELIYDVEKQVWRFDKVLKLTRAGNN